MSGCEHSATHLSRERPQLIPRDTREIQSACCICVSESQLSVIIAHAYWKIQARMHRSDFTQLHNLSARKDGQILDRMPLLARFTKVLSPGSNSQSEQFNSAVMTWCLAESSNVSTIAIGCWRIPYSAMMPGEDDKVDTDA